MLDGDNVRHGLCSDLGFSDVALRLGYPQYENALDDPLRLLAELPLPIYLTTSFATCDRSDS